MALQVRNDGSTTTRNSLILAGAAVGLVVLPEKFVSACVPIAGFAGYQLVSGLWKHNPLSRSRDMITTIWQSVAPGSRFPIGNYKEKIKNGVFGGLVGMGLTLLPGVSALGNSYVVGALVGAASYIYTDIQEGAAAQPGTTRRVGFITNPERRGDILDMRFARPVSILGQDCYTIRDAYKVSIRDARYMATIQNDEQKALFQMAYSLFYLNPTQVPRDNEFPQTADGQILAHAAEDARNAPRRLGIT